MSLQESSPFISNTPIENEKFDIQGNVISAEKDTVVDVNQVHDTVMPEGGIEMPATGLEIHVPELEKPVIKD